MPRAPDPRIDEAKALFESGLKLIEISKQLDVAEGTVRSWKNRGKWNATLQTDKRNVAKPRGAPKGNKNALNNNGGAPPQNKNAEKYGFFSKYLPAETKEIFDAVEHADPLDLLWHQIQIAYAAIIRAQRLMYVKDQEDTSTSKVGYKNGPEITEERWEVQYAWDKQANFLKAQARAQSELRGLIKQYDEMLHKNWDLVTEEQKARISALKARIDDDSGEEIADDGFIEALEGSAGEDWSDEE